MSKNTCTAVNVPAHLECQICYDTWRDPVQVLKCGHIFCRHCVTGNGMRCFICRGDITSTQSPGAKILETALAVPVVCSSCGWRGSRAEAETHRCDSRLTNTAYESYPQHTDEEWVRIATMVQNGPAGATTTTMSVTAVAATTVVGSGSSGPSGQYERRDVFTGIPM